MDIVYEDKNLIAVNKPAGISVYPSETDSPKSATLISKIIKLFPDLKNVGEAPRYGIVHRLDKETSGVVLIAKNDSALDYLQKQFELRKTNKKYLTLVNKKVKKQEGIIHTLIGRNPKNRLIQQAIELDSHLSYKKGLREAVSRFKVFSFLKDYTLLEVWPETGRRHQIRAHMQFIGHPVVGDTKYGFRGAMPKGLKRIFLHAHSLEITLPNNVRKKIIADLPKDLKSVIKNLSPKKIK